MKSMLILLFFAIFPWWGEAASGVTLPEQFAARFTVKFQGRSQRPASIVIKADESLQFTLLLSQGRLVFQEERDGKVARSEEAKTARRAPSNCSAVILLDQNSLCFLATGYAVARWTIGKKRAAGETGQLLTHPMPAPPGDGHASPLASGDGPNHASDAAEPASEIEILDGDGVHVSDLRVQPISAVEFADDFMRMEGTEGAWTHQAGLWKLDVIPYPTWSASPFRLRSDGKGTGLTTAGFWFWHDYAVRCAVRPGSGTRGTGLVFYIQGPKDYALFRWSERGGDSKDAGPGRGTFELVQVTDGKEKIVAARDGVLDAAQWSEFCLAARGQQVSAFIDGVEILHASSWPGLILGGIGLWAQDAKGALFDDVEAKGFAAETPAGPTRPSYAGLERLFGPYRVVIGERFAKDALMQEWSTPKGDWISRSTEKGQVLWHVGILGDEARLSWQVSWKPVTGKQPLLLAMAADGKDIDSGYVLRLGEEAVLACRGEILAAVPLPEEIHGLEWERQGGDHTLRVAGSPILSARHSDPLPAGKVGLLLPASSRVFLDPQKLTLDSPSIRDYTFSTAPVDWRVASGAWDITSRWICTPQWSWFGGVSHESAVIWSKRSFYGDQVVDLYSAVMMDFGVAGGYRRYGDINVTFCGDGSTLGSGYTFMYGGYDNTRTCLWRKGQIVAERGDRRYPDRGQGAHKNWYNVRAEKAGGNIRFFLNDELTLEYSDPEPLPGGHVALWTWDGGMMIPRVRIFGQPEEAPDYPAVSLAAGFAAGFAGAGDEFAARNFKASDPGHPSCTRFVNPQSGGDFTSPLPLKPFDALRSGVLSFDYRIPPEVRLHLYFEANGRDFYIALNGPEKPSEHILRQAVEISGRRISESAISGRLRKPARLASLALTADGQWHAAEIDLSAALRQFFPRAAAIEVRHVRFANWCNGDYLMCGLTGNPAGSAFFMDHVKLRKSSSRPEDSTPLKASSDSDSFEGDSGIWRPAEGSAPFKLFIDDDQAAEGRSSLHVAAGPLGFNLVLRDQLLDFYKQPAIAFDYRAEKPIPLAASLRVAGRWLPIAFPQTLLLDGQWHTAHLDLQTLLARRTSGGPPVIEGFALTSPERDTPEEISLWIDNLRMPAKAFPGDSAGPVVSARQPDADAKAASDKIQFLVTDDSSGIDAASLALEVDGKVYRLNDPAVAFKPLEGKLALQSGLFTLKLQQPFPDRKKISCVVHARDRAGNPVTSPSSSWDWVMDYREDALPPPAPYVSYLPSRRIVLDTFEDSVGEWSSRQASIFHRTSDTAATGRHSLEVLSGVTFVVHTPYDAGKFPVVRLDYCLQPGSTFDWLVRIDNTNWEIRCNPGQEKAKVLASIPGVKADGQWHRVEFDLLEMLEKRPEPGMDFIVEHLAMVIRGKPGRWFDNFTISARAEIEPCFEWSQPADATGITGYSLEVDELAESVPDETVDTVETKKVLKGLKPGAYYLHVRACDGAGRWGPAGHARVVVTGD